jgi:hypothetical protein
VPANSEEETVIRRGQKVSGLRATTTVGACHDTTPGVSLRAIRLVLLGAALLLLLATGAARARADCTQLNSTCQVTVTASTLGGDAINNYNFDVNVDNSQHVDPLTGTDNPFPQSETTQDYSPLVAEGNNGHQTVTVNTPTTGRQQFLISTRANGYKMWGAYFTVPATTATLTVNVQMTVATPDNPLPTGKIKVFVFNDNTWTNGAPDTEEAGLPGFQASLDEQTGSEVHVDYHNNPICSVPESGDPAPGSWPGCKTDADGFVQIDDLSPATYFIDVQPPVHHDGSNVRCNQHANSRWFQTTTIDGGFQLVAPTEEGSDGTGAPGEQLWEPADKRTAYWFGFVCAPQTFKDNLGGAYNPATAHGSISFNPRNWVGWPPFDVLTHGDEVDNPIVALSDFNTDRTIFVKRFDSRLTTEGGDRDPVTGNFTIPGVPDGQYNLAVWDEQLSYILRFATIVVNNGAAVNANDVADANGQTGLGVSRWFGWVNGYVYKDNGQTTTTTTANAAIGAGDTSITVASAADFPTTPGFYVSIDDETLQVTAISGNTWTVSRGQKGTTAAGHAIGSRITAIIPGGADNGIRDCIVPMPTTAQLDGWCEPPVPNSDMDQRWRDASIKDATFTDPHGYYEYPTAEGGALGHWFINEQGFARFSAFTGASVHNELQVNGRTDTSPPGGNVVVTGGSATVLDPFAKTIDVTYPVTGPGIPDNTVITQLDSVSTTTMAAISDTATSVTVTSAASFPASAPYPLRIANELVTVTNRVGAVLTITRGPVAVAHDAGTPVVVVTGFDMSNAATGSGNTITVGAATHVPTAQGGALLTNQLVTEGHRATIDWGKKDYLNQTDPVVYGSGTSIINDPKATAEWAGHSVTGAGIPPNTTMGDVVPGVSFTLKSYDGSTNVTTTSGGSSVSVAQTGQIVGISYFGTTRNEFDAFQAVNEVYETAIPDVTVYLETPGPDGIPNTPDDVIVNAYVTDHWQQPNASQDLGPASGWSQGCTVTDYAGYDISGQLNSLLGPNCIETPITGQQTKDGAFDGGYAFDSYCPNGINTSGIRPDGTWDPSANVTCAGAGDPSRDAHPLVAGDYITHMIMPSDPNDPRSCNAHTDPGAPSPALDPNVTAAVRAGFPANTTGCLFRVEKEEDVNVDLGQPLATPQIPPPPCVGDLHTIDQSTLVYRSKFSTYYDGLYNLSSQRPPLCDKHLVVLKNSQNANSDYSLITNMPTDPMVNPITHTPVDNHTGDVEEPGRISGLVSDDIYFETNPQSMWYGEPRPIGGIPVGIYERVDTVHPPASATLTGAIGTGDTTVNVNSAANFPAAGDYYVQIDQEFLKVTGGQGSTTWTVARGQNGSVAAAHANGASVVLWNMNPPYSPDKWRLMTTIWTTPEGTYQAMLPSTETFNCPIPQGPCPGMYMATINDPGSAEHPNHGYNPNILVATDPFEVWPGQTNQLDTPLDPISGTGCEDPAVPAVPELLEVSSPVVTSGGSRQITIKSDFIGTPGTDTSATGPHVNLTDLRTGTTTTLTFDNGGIASWNQGTSGTTGVPDQIVINVPATSPAFPPGQKQLQIVTSAANGAQVSVNGITLHVLGGALAGHMDVGATLTPRRFGLLGTANPGDRTQAPTPLTGVTGTGVPAGTTIQQVAPGLGFLASLPRTQPPGVGATNVTISRVDPGVTVTNGSNVVGDTNIQASDLGRRVVINNFNGPPPALVNTSSGNRTITSVTPGVSFTVSGAAASHPGVVAHGATITKLPTPQSANFVNRYVADTAATAAYLGAAVTGVGVPAGTTIAAVFPGVGFVLSASYTQNVNTVESLTIGGFAASYTPGVQNIYAPDAPTDQDHRVQMAIDSAAPGDIIVLHPNAGYTNSTFNENLLLWKPIILQGVGPGGIVGAHEFQARDPEDPRFHVLGTIIDGRYFKQHADAFTATVGANAPYAGVTPAAPVLSGADVTVVAKLPTSFNNPNGVTQDARIDGLGLSTGDGQGAGGIQLQEYANNTQMTNNVLENNGGVFGGGIGIGQPWVYQLTGGADASNHNFNVGIENDRLIGNGGLTLSGGIGIFYGSNGYDIGNSVICSNFGVEYGAGISHYGYSPGSKIHDNSIYYNEAVDSGAGIAVQTELPPASSTITPPYDPIIGRGSGSVDIDRNLIQSNFSADDGGGIFTLDAQADPINIRNNMIVNNGAADKGGAIMLDDSANVRIINNSIANNVTTDSCETCQVNTPQSAGLASESNDPAWQNSAGYISFAGLIRPDYSSPAALFNNIFWDNDAYTLANKGPGATLVDAGFIDFGIVTVNNADTFTPRFSDLTNGLVLHGDGTQTTVPGGQGNRPFGTDPLFVTEFINELTVTGSRLDPQVAAVTITGADPPVGLTGDYHLTAASPMIDRGSHCSNTTVPNPPAVPPIQALGCTGGGIPAPTGAANADYDRGARPLLRSLRLTTPWDIGADEVAPGVFIAVLPNPALRAAATHRHSHHHHHHSRHSRHLRQARR